MTVWHVIVICFALGVFAYCGSNPSCQASNSQLGTLVGSAIGIAGGNAMAAIAHKAKTRRTKRKRSNGK